MQYASQNLIPVTLELGGKSPNIFFSDVAAAHDEFYDKALEGFTMFALNQGEVCTCPSRALIQADIYDTFMADAVARTQAVKQGHPLDPQTMIGAQADVEPGSGSGFSVEAPDCGRFPIRSRLLTGELLDHVRLSTKNE